MGSDVRAIPEGMHSITPHIVVQDAARAAEWSEPQARFGLARIRSPSGEKLMTESLSDPSVSASHVTVPVATSSRRSSVPLGAKKLLPRLNPEVKAIRSPAGDHTKDQTESPNTS